MSKDEWIDYLRDLRERMMAALRFGVLSGQDDGMEKVVHSIRVHLFPAVSSDSDWLPAHAMEDLLYDAKQFFFSWEKLRGPFWDDGDEKDSLDQFEHDCEMLDRSLTNALIALRGLA